MEKEQLLVAGIRNGTVIDHIHNRYALKLIRLLELESFDVPLSVGVHHPSQSMGYKDWIKLEGYHLTQKQIDKLAVFSPKVTVNIIEDYAICKKIVVTLPDCVEDSLPCLNSTCITNCAKVSSKFKVSLWKDKTFLTCDFCSLREPHEKWLRHFSKGN